MAVPRSKVSKARTSSRKANWKLTGPTIVECPRCHKMKLSHRICRHCGYYDGREVIAVSDKKKKDA